MTLLGIDVGTTHCKAGLFTEAAIPCQIASLPTPIQRTHNGRSFYDPEQLWQTILAVMAKVTAAAPTPIAAIGIASMAETGLLLDRRTNQPRSEMIPWFDQSAAPQAKQIRQAGDEEERFCTFGIYPSFKCSLAKILWLREQDRAILHDAIWLHVADYIAYRLTGVIHTDYTLAGRTYAFNLAQREWDAAWQKQFDLTPDLFPHPRPSGTPLGRGVVGDFTAIGLAAGTPVAICGHDHLCAAFAAGAITSGIVFDSMGTAETLVGAIPERPLTTTEFHAGLTFGCHTAANRYYWLGGSAASGGSLEWLRTILNDPPLTYEALNHLLDEVPNEPGTLVYLPYLAGRSAPWPQPDMRGVFVGLSSKHTRADLLKAVLEGTAYQIEAIRQAAEHALGLTINRMICAGGGTRLIPWLQIKADVSGCQIDVLPTTEATLLGAALVAAVGIGLFANDDEALAATAGPARTIHPHTQRHHLYGRFYEQRFLKLQAPLQDYFRGLMNDDN